MAAPPVIIYRLGSIGDTVVALPCFHKIASVYHDRSRLVLTNTPVSSKTAPLELMLGPSGLIQGTLDYPIGTRSPMLLAGLMQRLRSTGTDTLVYLSAPRGRMSILRDLAFFKLCGMRTIIGAPLSADLREGRVDPVSNTVEPEAERLARSLAALGPIDLDDRSNWDLRLTVAEQAAADRALQPLLGRPFMAINIGGKAKRNDWGDDNWAALLRALAGDIAELGLAFVGGSEDSQRSAALMALWPGPKADLCGALLPRESAALLGRAAFFVGHDSGPMHLAAGMGTPSVGLFGDNNRPRMWHPYGPGNRAIHDMRGVRSIAVETVRDEVLAVARAGGRA